MKIELYPFGSLLFSALDACTSVYEHYVVSVSFTVSRSTSLSLTSTAAVTAAALLLNLSVFHFSYTVSSIIRWSLWISSFIYSPELCSLCCRQPRKIQPVQNNKSQATFSIRLSSFYYFIYHFKRILIHNG